MMSSVAETTPFTAACVAVCIALCAGYCAHDLVQGRFTQSVARFFMKTGASTAFILAALDWNHIGNPDCDARVGALTCAMMTEPFSPRGYLGVALILCFIGDVLLLFPSHFIGGLLAFLLGHVSLLGMFWSRGFSVWKFWVWAAGPLVLFFGWVSSWLLPAAGKLRLPVAAYIIVIMTMLASAIAGEHGSASIVAAVLFVLSDLGVARNRFIGFSVGNRLSLFLYYSAVLLFANLLADPAL
jgi:uncharacterized membrane protein YhhN